jgi:hypothetical protein
MRKISMFLAALGLATSVFWLTMLTTPPVSEASPQAQIDTRDLTLKSHPDGGLPCDAF